VSDLNIRFNIPKLVLYSSGGMLSMRGEPFQLLAAYCTPSRTGILIVTDFVGIVVSADLASYGCGVVCRTAIGFWIVAVRRGRLGSSFSTVLSLLPYWHRTGRFLLRLCDPGRTGVVGVGAIGVGVGAIGVKGRGDRGQGSGR